MDGAATPDEAAATRVDTYPCGMTPDSPPASAAAASAFRLKECFLELLASPPRLGFLITPSFLRWSFRELAAPFCAFCNPPLRGAALDRPFFAITRGRHSLNRACGAPVYLLLRRPRPSAR
jgi:hypothetical protein